MTKKEKIELYARIVAYAKKHNLTPEKAFASLAARVELHPKKDNSRKDNLMAGVITAPFFGAGVATPRRITRTITITETVEVA